MAYRFLLCSTKRGGRVNSDRGWILNFASDKDALEYLHAYNEMLEFLGCDTKLECPDISAITRVENIEFEWI